MRAQVLTAIGTPAVERWTGTFHTRRIALQAKRSVLRPGAFSYTHTNTHTHTHTHTERDRERVVDSSLRVAASGMMGGNIHPRNKLLLGERIARAAKAVVYGDEKLAFTGPVVTGCVPRLLN